MVGLAQVTARYRDGTHGVDQPPSGGSIDRGRVSGPP